MPPKLSQADEQFWAGYVAVASEFSHDVRLKAREGRAVAVFDLPSIPAGVMGVPSARLWHNLKANFVALDVTGVDKPLRVIRELVAEVPMATVMQEHAGGVRFRLLAPRFDAAIPTGECREDVRHALMQVVSLRRWWRQNLGNWVRWRGFADSAPVLEARRIPPHHTWGLRRKILRPMQDIGEMAWVGDTDETTIHVGGFADGVLAGIATLLKVAYPDAGSRPGLQAAPGGGAYQLRGMATDESARGTGLGKGLLQWCFQQARAGGATVLWCNARVSAVGFYEKNGMRVVSDEFDIPTVGPHVVMVIDL